MRRFGLRAVGMCVALLALAVPLVVNATPAAAADTNDVVAIGGSDTTQDVMNAVFNCGSNGECTVPAGVANVSHLYNLKVPPNVPQDTTVVGDTHCAAVTYESNVRLGAGSGASGVLPASGKEWTPFGSGSGKNALKNSKTFAFPPDVDGSAGGTITQPGGCLDIARSSSGPSGSCGTGSNDPCNFEYYAFALDAVGWVSPSLAAPPSLTLQQLQDIYDCKYNDWAQVGGKPGKIQRFLPQTGSGTGDFFITNVLGKASNSRTQFLNTGTVPAGAPVGAGTTVNCAPVIADGDANANPVAPPIEENNGKILLDPAYNALYQQAIIPYSSGKFVYQANNSDNPSLDRRAGIRPGGLVNPAVLPTAPVAWSVRWVNSAWSLNDGTIINPRATITLTNAGALNSTLTSNGSVLFTQADVGRSVQGTIINDGTIITSVAANGLSATISPSTLNTAKVPAGTYPYNGTITVGYSVVSEFNPNVLQTSNKEYAGVRYVYNVVYGGETAGTPTNSPSYHQARALVGFDDGSANGALSVMCDGSMSGVINSNGFLALPALDRDGATIGNDQPRTCVKRAPTP